VALCSCFDSCLGISMGVKDDRCAAREGVGDMAVELRVSVTGSSYPFD
jgi:hypothetical protein